MPSQTPGIFLEIFRIQFKIFEVLLYINTTKQQINNQQENNNGMECVEFLEHGSLWNGRP